MEPEDTLLELVKNNSLRQLREFLRNEDVSLNHSYEKREYETVLQLACGSFEDTGPQVIQLLVDNGADPFYTEPNCIYLAAITGKLDKLQVLLNCISKRSKYLRRCDAILRMIQTIREERKKESDYLKILEELLNTNIDINLRIVQHQQNATAIYLAAKYKFRDFVALIVEKKFNELDLDSYKDDEGNTARFIIVDKNLYGGPLPQPRVEGGDVTYLLNVLYDGKVSVFRNKYDDMKTNLKEDDKRELLYLCADRGLHELIPLFSDLDQNMLIPEDDEEETPFEVACRYGYFQTINEFLKLNISQENLHSGFRALIVNTEDVTKNKLRDYDKSFALIIKNEKFDINWSYDDVLTRFLSTEQCLEFLRKGASLAVKDDQGDPAVADFKPDVLKEYLNDCMQCENDHNDKDKCIEMDITSLLTPRKFNVVGDAVSIKMNDKVEEYLPETDVVKFISESSELEELLTHPVIMTFLYLKWLRINKFFYVNLGLYFLFFVVLIVYVLLEYTFKSDVNTGVLTASYVILIITMAIVSMRELSQIIMHKHRYFLVTDNWLEITVFVLVLLILTKQLNETVSKQLAAVAIVLSAMEVVILMGYFPKLSTNIIVLRRVSYTFLKLLSWYSILLLAFAVSFCMLFRDTIKPPNASNITNSNDDDDDDKDKLFENPGIALLKTLVMLTGELDTSDVNFDNFPFVSHALYVLFVFLITIVLYNLLNALAVSDAQVIKSDAELYGQIVRIELICQVEKIFLSNNKYKFSNFVKKICLFPDQTKKAIIKYYPNDNHRIVCSDDEYDQDNWWSRVTLEEQLRTKIASVMAFLREERMWKSKEVNFREQLDEIIILLKEKYENNVKQIKEIKEVMKEKDSANIKEMKEIKESLNEIKKLVNDLANNTHDEI